MNNFTYEYVIGTTLRKMLRAVRISLNKTVSRVKEFESDNEKSQEILRTILKLNEFEATIQASLTSLDKPRALKEEEPAE